MIVEILTMVGGALIGVPVQEAHDWAKRKARRSDELVEHALVESFLESVGSLADQAVRNGATGQERADVRSRCRALRNDALTLLGLASSQEGSAEPLLPMAGDALLQTARQSGEEFSRAVNDALMARLRSSPSWLGDAPESLVAAARTQLLAGTLAAFRRRATDDEGLFRALMLDAAALAGYQATQSSHRSDRLEDFGLRLDNVVRGLAQQHDALLASADETHEELQSIRLAALALLARQRDADIAQLPLPQRFRSLLSEKCRDFVGRGFVYRELESWMAANPCGYFTVRADPGMGKSAVLANYVRRTGCIAYFNQRSCGLTRASQFLESICHQLAERSGVPRQAVPDNLQDGGTFAELLDEASSHSEGPLVLAVDALDEVDLSSQDRTANILYLPSQLPQGVYVLLTKRDVPLPLAAEVPSNTLDLMGLQYRSENIADAREYLDRSADTPAVANWIRESGLTREGYVHHLAQRSQANFMYLRHVVADITAGRWTHSDPDVLPTGLQDYYANHWRVMDMENMSTQKEKLEVLYVLLEYQEPVSIRLLSEITGEQATTVAWVLKEWNQFLRRETVGGESRFSFYHESFADFLRREDILEASRIDLAEINEMISLRLLQDFE
ncbi:P-loop domain-containing protein [Streptomyces shenzhenensis]|uniref:hypothetical protein n=1 Tax=Streptomyces shenzhenensis TaxID=943815 RepID=UPI0015F11FE9|nr:hypothetical protein [Streptomyces shenzhenensis]